MSHLMSLSGVKRWLLQCTCLLMTQSGHWPPLPIFEFGPVRCPLSLASLVRSSFESRATRSRLRMTAKGRSLLKQEGISMKVGFIGLGRMGQAVARRLLEAKHDVGVYNRTPEKIKDIGGAKSLNSIEQACRYGAAVFSMLADDAALAQGSEQNGGLLQSLPKGGIHICSGTHGVAIIKKLTAAHKEREQILVAAPVLARPEMVASGQAAVVIGGPEDELARCKPLFDAIGRRTFKAGSDPGAAAALKISNHVLLGSAV